MNIYEVSFISAQGYNQWNNDVVEQWKGSNRKQSYSYLIQSNSTASFTWTFQRTEELNAVRHDHTSRTSLLIYDRPTASLPQPQKPNFCFLKFTHCKNNMLRTTSTCKRKPGT